jgi:metal-responsive CopG/Arc/MetJ family transcriptional regulator
VTVSLPSDLVKRLDRESRLERTSRSGMAERWLRAGERQGRVSSLEQELERYYSENDEAELTTALATAARAVAGGDRAPRRGRSRPAR